MFSSKRGRAKEGRREERDPVLCGDEEVVLFMDTGGPGWW